MNGLHVLLALATCACGRQAENATPVAPRDELVTPQAPASKPAAVIPMPKDQTELDRLISAGYTPHGTHLHSPGVKECPIAQGSEAVM